MSVRLRSKVVDEFYKEHTVDLVLFCATSSLIGVFPSRWSFSFAMSCDYSHALEFSGHSLPT